MSRTLLCFAILAVLALSAVADDGKFDKNGDGGQDGRGQRKITKVVGPHSIMIRADKSTADQKNRLFLQFTTNGFPRLRLGRVSVDESDDNKAGFTFRLGLRRVVEFVDQGTNCLDTNDTIASQFSLIGHSGQWTNIQESSSTVVLSDNTTATTWKYCTSLSRSGATFTLCLRLSDRAVTDAKGHTFGPRRVKLDIEMDNYQFASTGTKLALVALVSSRTFATNASNVPNTVFFNSDGAVDWQGSLDIPLGWPVVATAVRDLADLDRTQNGNDGNDGDDSDDSFKSVEIAKAVGFCIDNSTHTNQYLWDPSAEINDQGSAAAPAAALAFFVPLLMVLLSLLSFN